MKRFWTVLLVVTVAIVMALPAGAVKPPKPPKPPTSVPIGVSVDAQPVWTHEGGDVLRYTVTLQNKTGTEITDVTVTFSAATTASEDDGVVPHVDEFVGVVLPANDSITFDESDGLTRDVSSFAEFELYRDRYGEEFELPATVTVSLGTEVLTQMAMSTPFMPDPPCGFVYDEGFDFTNPTNSVTVDYLCIWTLPSDEDGVTKTGVWEITLWPTLPDNTRRPLEARVDVRDGVPGNWCPLAIGDPWGFGDRWKAPYPDDLSVTGQVYLPGAEDHWNLELDDGMCVSGGAGGDYFKVGNPNAFYLRANGDVTVQWVRATP